MARERASWYELFTRLLLFRFCELLAHSLLGEALFISVHDMTKMLTPRGLTKTTAGVIVIREVVETLA